MVMTEISAIPGNFDIGQLITKKKKDIGQEWIIQVKSSEYNLLGIGSQWVNVSYKSAFRPLGLRWMEKQPSTLEKNGIPLLNTSWNTCRYYSLCAYMGDDDLFISDLSDDQLRIRLGHMSNTPCQVLLGFIILWDFNAVWT